MDPISLIETALVTGAATSTKDTASQAIKDAYNSLKMFLSHLFADKPKAQAILEEHETDPKTYEKLLKKWLIEAHADQNTELLAAAKQVLKLVQPQQMGMGKYTIQNNGPVQGQTIGEGNTITQHFGDPPRA